MGWGFMCSNPVRMSQNVNKKSCEKKEHLHECLIITQPNNKDKNKMNSIQIQPKTQNLP